MALNVGWNGKLLFVESKLPVMKRPEDNAPRNISTTSDEPDRKTAAKADPTLEADNDRAATSSENNEGGVSSENNEEFIRQWEQEAHLHFKKSSWKGESVTVLCNHHISSSHFTHYFISKDVVHACQQALSVPGQDESNYEVLFKIGYAYMRLEEYETAARYFQAASRIDSTQITLKFAIQELKRKVQTGPWRKKRKSDNDDEEEPHAKRPDTKR